jgi:hypothetical protein
MTTPESSSTRVPYDLRPRKQVERRMMVHVFQLLAEAGFSISTYRYAGFGAFFFVDFVLFRRLLAITDMVSIEHDISYKRRVLFNRPFKDIEVKFESSSDYISKMNRDKPHILWLDYDGPIAREQLADLETAASVLSPGSALLATFDVDFDRANDVRIKESFPNQRAGFWFERFQEECGDFFDPIWNTSDFNAADIPKRVMQVVKGALFSGLNMRNGINFEPLFGFIYADGHQMLTVGGVICSKHERRKLRSIDWEELPFVRRKLPSDPFRIEVPVFTRRERLYVDSHMPCEADWAPAEFEIEQEAIQNYREVYRYCPLYAELLL